MKIEDLKAGRVYRAKRPRVVHTLGGSYINDRQILSISPFEDTIQYDSPKVGFGSKYPVISVEKFLKWAAKDITDDLPRTYYLFEVKMKAERIQQLKKAYIFYWRRIRTLLATGHYILTIDYRKKDINNEK